MKRDGRSTGLSSLALSFTLPLSLSVSLSLSLSSVSLSLSFSCVSVSRGGMIPTELSSSKYRSCGLGTLNHRFKGKISYRVPKFPKNLESVGSAWNP